VKRLWKALVVLGALVAVGIIGYHVLEDMTILDALYMTVTTILTVGFGEMHPLSPIGRAFTISLILFRVSTMAWAAESMVEALLARIIHQPEKSTREGPFGGQLILNTTVFQDHQDPKASASDGLGSVRIGLSVAIRRTSSGQPPWADNHRFTLEPPEVAIALTGPAASDVHTLTT
jgi:hypothetical protein